MALGLLWCGTSHAEKPVYDCSNAPHPLSKYPGTCWGDAVWHCLFPNGQKAYDQIQSLKTAGSPGEQGKPYTDGGKEAYELYLKLCKTFFTEQIHEIENLREEVEKLRDEEILEQDEDKRLFEERSRWLLKFSKEYKIKQNEKEIRIKEQRKLRKEKKERQKKLKKLKKLKEEKEKKLREKEERVLWYLKAVGNIKKMKQIEKQRLREEEQQKQNEKQSLINEAEKQRLREEEQQKQNEKQSLINEQQQQRLIEEEQQRLIQEEQQRQNEQLQEECNEELQNDCNRVFGIN